MKSETKSADDAIAWMFASLARVFAPEARTSDLKSTFDWAIQLTSAGLPLPPLQVVADLGNLLVGRTQDNVSEGRAGNESLRTSQPQQDYLDHFLGRLISDPLFDRLALAVQGLPTAEQKKGIVFLIKILLGKLPTLGVEVPPGTIRTVTKWNRLQFQETLRNALIDQPAQEKVDAELSELVHAFRPLIDPWGNEELVALEHRTAIGDLGQYVAHRQIVRLVQQYLAELPQQLIVSRSAAREVPTSTADEDVYPVGGYSSIGTRGSLESLLHSQLAYMEPDGGIGDLFDAKYVRNELFYYTRDENQFYRRKRNYFFLFDTNLTQARFKDADSPAQRLVLALAGIVAVMTRLQQWTQEESTRFELVFFGKPTKHPLNDEIELLKIFTRNEQQRRELDFHFVQQARELQEIVARRKTGSRLEGLLLTSTELPNPMWQQSGLEPTVFQLDQAVPALLRREELLGNGKEEPLPDGFDGWIEQTRRLLELWA